MEAAKVIMEVLTEDDEVDVNDGLYDYIYDHDKANDYFKLKHILIWLRRSYLLCSSLAGRYVLREQHAARWRPQFQFPKRVGQQDLHCQHRLHCQEPSPPLLSRPQLLIISAIKSQMMFFQLTVTSKPQLMVTSK